MKNIKNVIFDLGGVLVDLDIDRCTAAFRQLGMNRVADLINPCYPAVMIGRLERGDLSFHEACDAMRKLDGRYDVTDALIAGAYGGEMADVIVSARCMAPDGTISVVPKSEMELGYRKRIFRQDGRILLGVTLQLQKGSYVAFKEELDSLLGKRRAKEPLELPSAGCTFQRPVGNYASFLIDQCGLKGASVGDAQVSVKHAGFVVNTGKATCRDVQELCDFIKQTVLEKTGYQLELEPVIGGDPAKPANMLEQEAVEK